MHSTPIAKLLAFLVTLTLVIAASLPARDPLAEENLQPIVWRGEVNGQAYEVDGTVEQAWAHLHERFPDAYPDVNLEVRDTEMALPLDSRQMDVTGTICIPVPGWGWTRADAKTIYNGELYLGRINQQLCMEGPGHCGRVSCSYNSAIYWCNDNPNWFCVNSVNVAQAADDIRKKCSVQNHKNEECGGQAFLSDGWNVIVRADSC